MWIRGSIRKEWAPGTIGNTETKISVELTNGQTVTIDAEDVREMEGA